MPDRYGQNSLVEVGWRRGWEAKAANFTFPCIRGECTNSWCHAQTCKMSNLPHGANAQTNFYPHKKWPNIYLQTTFKYQSIAKSVKFCIPKIPDILHPKDPWHIASIKSVTFATPKSMTFCNYFFPGWGVQLVPGCALPMQGVPKIRLPAKFSMFCRLCTFVWPTFILICILYF